MDQHERVQGWIKRNDRKPVDLTAVVNLADGRSLSVRLINISHEGCRIEAPTTLTIGEKLRLELADLGPIPAQVRWSLQGEAGLQFLLGADGADDEPPVAES